jgi:dipeptidyl-peptidase-4
MTEPLSFPRQYARTQRFTLGAPRAFAVSPDAERVAFLRSRTEADRSHLLWVLDLTTGEERIAADPDALLSGAEEKLSAAERARRERSREGSAGIVGYATDAAGELAAFALSGRLFVAELRAGTARELAVPGPVMDPHPSPDGRRVAYVSGGALRVVETDGTGDRALAEPEGDQITYGLAEFIAAEEMSRSRGYWWAPDGTAVLTARVDESPVRRWWIADPANPAQAPAEVAYPAAGTANAEVGLVLLGLDGSAAPVPVAWDREAFPYLAQVHWSAGGPPLLLVQARDQRGQLFLAVDPGTGNTSEAHREEDEIWLDLFPGVPAWTDDGRLVRITDETGSRCLSAGQHVLTGPELHVRAVLDIGEEDILVAASAGAAATLPETGEIHVYRVGYVTPGVVRISDTPGVHSAVRSGPVTVLTSSSLDRTSPLVRVLRDDKSPTEIASYAATPVLTARPVLDRAGDRRIPAAVLLPTGYRDGDGPLPVLMDPYGGPHGQMVLSTQRTYLESQWLADQGFAVVVADGRGTPGHSPAWEKAVAHEFATVTLDDQVDALHSLARTHPLDLGRVGIRGWSYGGYLAALAVLRRPDVFHAAVAGAPVSDWRLYDTHYTERYLGDPATTPQAYAKSSLVTDEGLSSPAGTHRPLMIVHGLADDNVVVAHSLRLSSALLAAGRPHEVLPLSGVTHMTPQEQVAENLLLLQVDFLKRSLGLT